VVQDVPSVQHVPSFSISDLLQEYNQVFNGELGAFKGPPVTIQVDPNCVPKFSEHGRCHFL